MRSVFWYFPWNIWLTPFVFSKSSGNISIWHNSFFIRLFRISLTVWSFSNGSLISYNHARRAYLFFSCSLSITSVSAIEPALLLELSYRSLYGHYQIAFVDDHSCTITFKLNLKWRNSDSFWLECFPCNILNIK